MLEGFVNLSWQSCISHGTRLVYALFLANKIQFRWSLMRPSNQFLPSMSIEFHPILLSLSPPLLLLLLLPFFFCVLFLFFCFAFRYLINRTWTTIMHHKRGCQFHASFSLLHFFFWIYRVIYFVVLDVLFSFLSRSAYRLSLSLEREMPQWHSN